MNESMRRGWQVAASALLLTFGFFAFESYQLSLRDALGPGPGFFPFWLSVLGIALAIVLLVQLHAHRVELGSETLVFERARTRTIMQVMAGLIVAAALMEPVGYRVSMLLLIAYLLLVLGVRRWVTIGLCALAGSFGVFHVFFDLLKVPLPVGIFGF